MSSGASARGRWWRYSGSERPLDGQGHGHYGWRQQQKNSRRRLGIARQDHYDWLVVDVDWKGLACIVVDVDWKGLACSGC